MTRFTYASIPLAHDTLSREEVAKRLLKAAKIGGYKIDKDPFFSTLQTMNTHFIVYDYGLYSGFFSHSGVGIPERLTLEEFEAHCEQLKNQNT